MTFTAEQLDPPTVAGPNVPPPEHKIVVHDDTQQKLLDDIPSVETKPLWTQMSVLVPPRPNPKAMAYKWAYKDVRPHLIRAGELVPEEQAERRVLMLINPKMGELCPAEVVIALTADAPYTTDTLYAGLQLVQPGETAPAHRHSAFAVRFIIEGNGGFTAVQGKRIRMSRGDFILTPFWQWHDHGNDGASNPMIWLDGLDLPLFQHFPVHFAQHYSSPRYPAEDAASAPILFPWSETQPKLDASIDEHVIVRYTSQEKGKEGHDVSLRIGAQVEKVRKGAKTGVERENASAVYHVISGTGRTVIGDQAIEWVKGDTFCVPAWAGCSHEAAEETYLFRYDDRPMLKALGIYRHEKDTFLADP